MRLYISSRGHFKELCALKGVLLVEESTRGVECKGEAGGDIADKRELDKANSKTEREALERGDRRREDNGNQNGRRHQPALLG